MLRSTVSFCNILGFNLMPRNTASVVCSHVNLNILFRSVDLSTLIIKVIIIIESASSMQLSPCRMKELQFKHKNSEFNIPQHYCNLYTNIPSFLYFLRSTRNPKQINCFKERKTLTINNKTSNKLKESKNVYTEKDYLHVTWWKEVSIIFNSDL